MSDQQLNDGDSRRSFIKKITAATAAIVAADLVTFATEKPGNYISPAVEIPWYRKVTRWGQTNITEKDPQQYDISWWRKQWKRTQVQGVIINAGGIVSYYPSKVPLHRPSRFLNGRDLFGELCRAAKEDGMAVFARMDSNRASEEFYKAHPDWFAVDAEGKPHRADDLYITCVNGPYYNEHIPAILREIIALYHPEGFTDNSWSGLGRNTPCYCENCKKSFRALTGKEIPTIKDDWGDKTYQQWIRWNYDRRLEIWDLNNRTTKAAGGPDCTWSGMNSGSISGQSSNFRDYIGITSRADIMMIDDQGRSDASGFQHNGDIGKFLHGLLGWDKLIPESMAMYQQGNVTFRLASKPAAEARMWMIEGLAGGIQPWWHHVSAYHEDRRAYHTAEPVMRWHKTNEQYLINRHPIATIGVVWSQQNTDFYGRDNAGQLVDLPYRGITEALLKARIPYIPVHADHIDRDAPQLSLLILPNFGAMTDGQVASVNRFVNGGGGLIATGESSLYDEWGNARSDYALSDLFGAHLSVPGRNIAAKPAHTYLRLTPELRAQVDGPEIGNEPAITGTRHPILKGFDETDILPYGGKLEHIKIDAGVEVLMTYIPEFPIYPPETSWMRQPKTDIPGLILNNKHKGRVAFMPADIDRRFGQNNLPDHGDLLGNLIRWAAKDNIPLQVEGVGMIDCHLYRQSGCLIIHMVNLTNSATWRQPIHELIAVGPFKINVKLPDDVRGKKMRLLVADQQISPVIKNGWVSFEIKSILDHEMVVLS